MKIDIVSIQNFRYSFGLVVVIDVIRAFTTAAYAFSKGAHQIIAVSQIEDALKLQQIFPCAWLVGESEGKKVDHFHFDNSPAQMNQQTLCGRTLIQRTSCGTQGIIKAAQAEKILVSSFTVAEATIKRIRALDPSKVTLMMTGFTGGDEDLALAEYLEKRLKGEEVSLDPYLCRVENSPLGKSLKNSEGSEFFKLDLEAVLSADRFPFAMEVFQENTLMVIKPVLPTGALWRYE